MSDYNEDELNKQIKQRLDDSVDSLDANTISEIRQTRSIAMERVGSHDVSRHRQFMLGGFATACVMVLAVMLLINTQDTSPDIPVDDIELISSSDTLELFEDLEFYEWLEEDGLTG